MKRLDLLRVSCVSMMMLAACSAGPAKKGATTTPQAQNGQKPPVQKSSGGGDEVMSLGDESTATPTPAAPEEKEPADTDTGPKPPTQDLPKEKRDALVKDQLNRGIAALRAHDPDGLIRAARAALDIDESNVEAMVMLANGYYVKGYDDKAEAVLNIAKKQRAGDAHPVLWMILGLVYDRTNREDQALAAYERATRIKPDYLAALTNRGAIYLKRKRYQDAIQVFEQVVQLHDKSPSAHMNLGSAYRGRSADFTGQNAQRDQLLKRAEAQFKLAMSQDAAYAPAFFNIGILYLDADPFPGVDTLQRLQLAAAFLADYKKKAGPQSLAAADEYLTAAQKGIEREQKLLERKKKQQQKKGGGS